MNIDKVGLRELFSAWLGPHRQDNSRFFHSGLIVFDTNALFALYSVEPVARDQVIEFFNSIKERIWIPHQVGLEFARNRDVVVQSRNKSWGEAKTTAQRAEREALRSLESAIESVQDLRHRTLSQREWDLQSVKLDQESLESRLDGVMKPVLDELEALKKEQDKSITNIQQNDPILTKLDPILSGRIGPAYSSSQLKAIIDEALEFRFPNQIPPGYRDKGKSTPLHAAGDFIIWQQLLDKVKEDPSIANVVLVTNDTKPDWWKVDSDGNPTGPRQELVQEMKDSGKVDFLLLTLADFVAQAPKELTANVSIETIDQIRSTTPIFEHVNGLKTFEIPDDFNALHRREFEGLIGRLLVRMGFIVHSNYIGMDGSELDFVATRETKDSKETYAIEVKKSVSPIPRSTVFLLHTIMQSNNIKHGIIFAPSGATTHAILTTRKTGIEIIDGKQLQALLHKYFNDADEVDDT